jgi:cell volume regulation protein A
VEEGTILLLVGAVLTASLVVAFGASRTGVPSLVAFLALGMLLGSDGLGGIEFDDAELARKVGVVCLVAILFEGGLSTSGGGCARSPSGRAPEHGRGRGHGDPHGSGGLRLFDLTWLESVLLGAVVSSTTRRRCSRPSASRASRGGSPARSRRRPAATTRWRSRSRSG